MVLYFAKFKFSISFLSFLFVSHDTKDYFTFISYRTALQNHEQKLANSQEPLLKRCFASNFRTKLYEYESMRVYMRACARLNVCFPYVYVCMNRYLARRRSSYTMDLLSFAPSFLLSLSTSPVITAPPLCLQTA